MKIVFLTDFDGTVSQDILLTLFKRYAQPGWQESLERYRSGEIGSRQLHLEITPGMRVSQRELRRFLYYHCFIEPYFSKFIEFCSQANIPVAIVSDGLDIYIHQMLENAGIKNLTVFSNYASFDGDRLRIAFPSLPENCSCGTCGNCKRAVCWKYKEEFPGHLLVYAGDGPSDVKVLGEVDLVFAKDRLASYCRLHNIDFTEFNDFSDILSDIMRIAGSDD
ncbi:MAG: MtnX-like HAD-IB family phosphatase [Bacillota bacterium]|nr:MtnX-like HAD-IB family phosphatase [Bacillota bacterium]MDW7683764.1 MtnX-like HAD-IB family phosphatase [Bacillota bacterium]